MSVFCGGEKEVLKESLDKNALYFKIKEGDRIVGDGGHAGEPSKIVVWRDEHSRKYKKFIARVSSSQETFLMGSRTGEFSSTILLMEGALKKRWTCIRWLSKPLL
jgi:hypothetical protein